jgi:hypothetical protein
MLGLHTTDTDTTTSDRDDDPTTRPDDPSSDTYSHNHPMSFYR